MQFEIQAHALLPHVLFSAGYLLILFAAKTRRDALGFILVTAFCVTLGLRDIAALSRDCDPVTYAFLLSYPGDISALVPGVDYVLFSLLHAITGAWFDLAGCFFVLHLLYIPAIYVLYRVLKGFPGVFFLLAGWLIFVNSGLLLLANFFRQGICVIVFLSLLAGLCLWPGGRKSAAALTLPLLHLGSAIFVPCLLACRRKHYFFISGLFFISICAVAYFAPSLVPGSSGYFSRDSDEGLHQTQLLVKVISVYFLLGLGYLLTPRSSETPETVRKLQRGAVGLLLPTAALLFTYNAPAIGLRYLYYSYALAFLYVSSAIAYRKSETLFKLSAAAICLFGIVTWTYPTVAILMIW
ncbi:MAG: hypothetical protein ABSF23_03180 [Terracidiphilus sp.]